MALITDIKKQLSTQRLLERFENDMIHDAHSFAARYSRSAARKELLNRGPIVLRYIVERLVSEDAKRTPEMGKAWLTLVDELLEGEKAE